MKKFLTPAALVAASLTVFVSSHIAQAAPPTNKVTICHRTHSVTNPYVRITVNQSSVGNGNGKHGGNSHDQYSTVLFPGGKPTPNVYNPAVTYSPAPEKKWGDIISFTDTAGNALTGNAGLVAGLNNTGIGNLIFLGSGQYANLCKTMNPRDYYEVEVNEGGQAPTDVLSDMNEFDADEFASALSTCGGTFTGCAATSLGTTSISVVTTTSTTTAPSAATTTTVARTAASTTGTLPAGVTLASGKGALTVNVWVDANRNGKKSSTEKYMKGITVKATGPTGSIKTSTTDANGNVTFTDLDPGTWKISSVIIDGYEKVYDSDGSVNWAQSLTVTAGSVAAASFAAAVPSSASATAGTATLAATGMRTGLPVSLMAMVLVLLGGLALAARRRTA